jgi:PAS domain S-box-containing protein
VRRAGQAVSEVAIYAREITNRKRAENELRRLYQAIQQSPSSVLVTDVAGRIVYVNPKFCEVTGYAHEEVMGRNPRILKSGHTRPCEYKQLWDTITAGSIWRGEFHNRKKNGDLYWEIASIGPVKDDHGQIINFVAVKEDVTERRAVEEQLRQSQKMQAIGQLTGGIAHDFNNLLTIILGNLQLLEQSDGKDERRGGLIDDALWAATRGGELTHRLLAFARMQSLRPAIVNLNDIVRGLTDLLRRTLGSRIDIVEELDPGIPSVLADPGELERALVNLAINARDAMPDGGVLSIQTKRAILDADYVKQCPDVVPGDYVMLTVRDTGTGIPAQLLGRIFEPFFTTKEVGQGSGLGLSMVYGFVKQSGGHVGVSSEPGVGTAFKLFFRRPVTAGSS